MADRAILAEQLKQTTKLTGGRWVVWLRHFENQWEFYIQHALTRSRQTALSELLQQPDVTAWLAGSMSSGRMRSRGCGPFAEVLGCARLYVFANPHEKTALLIGADGLTRESQSFLKVLSLCDLLPAWGSEAVASLNAPDDQLLAENANLRQETLDLTRRLNLIHDVIQQVVGLTSEADILQLSAQLIGGHFLADFASLFIVNELGQYQVNPKRREADALSLNELQLLESLAEILSSMTIKARLNLELAQRIESQSLAEKKLLQSARLAALGEMAAGVAHEINNPLTTVAGFVELALDELSPELPQREELELVLGEARRARAVVRRLLDFARQNESERIQSDLNDLVSDVLTLVQHHAQTGGVQLQVELWNDLPPIVVDPNQIKQVLVNLIQNALQAMPQGGNLTLRTVCQTRDGQEGVAVSVSDSGEGISRENLDRIFEPFFTTRPAGKGTGLGLSVTYGIVSDHGGHIEVESDLESGSCFTVWLPILKMGMEAHG